MHLRELICGCLRENMDSIRGEREKNLKRWRDWNSDRNGKVVVFGAATMCEICVRHFESLGINVDVICDNNSSRYGEFVTDSGKKIKIVSVEEAMSDDREKLCFAAVGEQHFEDISKQLARYKIEETVCKSQLDFYLETMVMVCAQQTPFMDKIEELLSFYEEEESLKILWAHFAMLFELSNIPEELGKVSMKELCVRPQYFLEDGKYLKKQGVMIDCGAYVGDTLEDLIYKTGFEDFEEYHCYEVFPATYRELRKTVDRLPAGIQDKVRTYSVGVGEKDAVGSALSGEYNSCILRNGDTEIRTVRLDDVYAGGNVTFLKMDIEGSEQAALRGGREMITKCRPMCAICVYHSLAAFWEIPKMLKEWVPEYHMILRHHTMFWDDTVCYTKIGEWN